MKFRIQHEVSLQDKPQAEINSRVSYDKIPIKNICFLSGWTL